MNAPRIPSKCQIEHKGAIARGDVTESYKACELPNVVETALSEALVLAARRTGGTWSVLVPAAP